MSVEITPKINALRIKDLLLKFQKELFGKN